MEEVPERSAAPAPSARVPRTIMTTKTALSDRFQQFTKAKPSNFGVFGAPRSPEPEFDLEHSNGLELDEEIPPPPQQPTRHVTTTARNLMSTSRAATSQDLLLLQLQAQAQAAKARNRQNLQTQRIIAQARLAAQAEIAAVLSQPGFLGRQEDFGFGFPSAQLQLGGFPGFGQGFPGGYGPSFLNYANQSAGNATNVARALAQAPARILTGRGGKVGAGAPRGNFNQGLNGVRKANGSIIKTSTGLAGRGRGGPFGNISARFSKPGQEVNSPQQGQNKNRKRGNNAVGVMAGISGAGPVKREVPTKEQLDDEMDEYMSQCKSSKCLDKELDVYMLAAKAKAKAVAAAQLAAEQETTKQEEPVGVDTTDMKLKIEEPETEQVPIDIDVDTILADDDSGSAITMDE